MMELYAQWKLLALQLRLGAAEAINDETRGRMMARADTLENCANELIATYLTARD